MRKVVASLFYSVDGVVEAPDKWVTNFDEDMGDEMSKAIAQQDDVLLGRVTYQEWAAYWPTSQDEPFATFINNVRKHVASSSLKQVEWKNARLLGRDVAADVKTLKASSGRDIGVQGSIRLVQWLIKNQLVDELTLTMPPIVAGSGRRLFEPSDRVPLRLVRSRVSKTGTAMLTYEVVKTS